MSYRSAQIAVQPETVRRLRFVLKLYPITIPNSQDLSQRLITVDELADRELNTRIKDLYPAVIELEKKLAAVEAEAIKKANATYGS